MATNQSEGVRLSSGQRVQCGKCGAEVEVVKPCTCEPNDMVLECCGQEMKPAAGTEGSGSVM